MKNCIICEDLLTANNTTWYRQKNYIHKCNDCSRKEKADQARKFREKDPSEANARSRKCRSNKKKHDPIGYTSMQMVCSASKRAKMLGINFDLTAKFVKSICPVVCPVFGLDLKYGGGDKTKFSASLDRIDSCGGYTMDNVMVLSSLANTMKSNASRDELSLFADWVKTT